MNLGHRVTIEQQAGSTNGYGENVGAWSALLTRIAAHVVQPSGREALAAGANVAEVPIRVFIRFRSNVTPQMRLVHAGRTYDITAVIPVAGGRDWLELNCVSAAA